MAPSEEKLKGEGIGAGGMALVAIVIFGFSYILQKYKISGTTEGSTGLAMASTILVFFANIGPLAMLTFGLISDVFNSEFRLSIPSIAALIAVFLVGITTQSYAAINSTLDTTAQDSEGRLWCTIPGLEAIESPYIPTAFVATACIVGYYLIWLGDSPVGTASWIFGGGVVCLFGVQIASFIAGDCAPYYQQLFGSIVFNIVIAVVIGLAAGGITYASVKNMSSKNPFNLSVNSPGKGGGKIVCDNNSDERTCKVEKFTAETPKKSIEYEGDEATFVAEIYKNGQLVTPTLAE